MTRFQDKVEDRFRRSIDHADRSVRGREVGRMVAYALLDVADAIREHSATVDRIELRQHRRAREGRS